MKFTFTRECTEVYGGLPLPDHLPEFLVRKVNQVDHFHQRVFKSQDRFDSSKIKEALTELQARLDVEKHCSSLAIKPSPKNQNLSWKKKVNTKRNFIKRVIENMAQLNTTEIARFTGSSKDTVKRVQRELSWLGDVSPFEYNNLKSQEETEDLQRTTDELPDTFMTVTMIKRRHPRYSRKKILEELHGQGYRYHMLPKERKVPIDRKIVPTRVNRLISHIAQAVLDPNTTVLYIDEMKFPLVQTAEKRWTKVGQHQEATTIYNRRQVPDTTLTAIALCSVEKFEAVQLFQGEVTGADFLYFLNNAISRFPPRRHYTIIADNATWHHAKIVSGSGVGGFLYFNEPRLFELNIIENAFSFVRHAFRCRPTLATLELEAKEILSIFFADHNRIRFKGCLRQHVRHLINFSEGK